jgi:Zn-dependent protease
MSALISIAAFIIAISVHEYAHAWAAHKAGDDTAKNQGRLTLNPIAHADPIGSVLIPLMLIITNAGFVLGWAKPVQINPNNFRDRRDDEYWVSLAGPLSNYIQALAASIIIGIAFKTGLLSQQGLGFAFLNQLVLINIVLGTFNLIPIPPLDGFSVLKFMLPESMEDTLTRIEPMGNFILLFLVISGHLFAIIRPVILKLYSFCFSIMNMI